MAKWERAGRSRQRAGTGCVGEPMKKPVLYLQRDEGHWTVVHQGRQLGFMAAADVALEQALQMAKAAYPDYDVRVWAWEAPKRDSID